MIREIFPLFFSAKFFELDVHYILNLVQPHSKIIFFFTRMVVLPACVFIAHGGQKRALGTGALDSREAPCRWQTQTRKSSQHSYHQQAVSPALGLALFKGLSSHGSQQKQYQSRRLQKGRLGVFVFFFFRSFCVYQWPGQYREPRKREKMKEARAGVISCLNRG